MAETSILELRQKDSSDVERNGIYKVTLDSAIQIEQGDQVNVKAIYLDTSESSAGLISLEDPVDIDMEIALYIQNYNYDQKFTTNITNTSTELRQYPNLTSTSGRTPAERGDNAIWWLAQHQENTSDIVWQAPILKLILLPGVTEIQKITIQFRYTPTGAGAQPTTFNFNIKKTPSDKFPPGLEFPWGLLSKGDGDGANITLISIPDNLKAAGIGALEWEQYEQVQNRGDTIFNLQRFPLKFTIPEGDYTPGELADIMTVEMSNIENLGKVSDLYDNKAATPTSTKTNWPAMSPFLTTILKNDRDIQLIANAEGVQLGQCFVNATDYETTAGNLAGNFYMSYNIVGMKGEFTIGGGGTFNPSLDKYIGGNQVGLIFNPLSNKLEFNLHFPIYVNGSSATDDDAVPGVIYNAVENTDPTVFNIPTGMPLRYSGAAFTKLEPADFWEKKLGFEDFTISEVHNANCRFPTAADNLPTQNNSFTIQAADGVNITGAFPSLDVGVIKNEVSYSTPPTADIETNTTTTISNPAIWSINSTKTYNNSVAAEGYFLVDVSPNFNQNLIGGAGSGQSSKSTQSIVNRYYTQNSFTSDQGAGSINYTHQGAPEMLSEFQVRVLNPDRSNVDPTILQDKNTVFVEVIKAVKEN